MPRSRWNGPFPTAHRTFTSDSIISLSAEADSLVGELNRFTRQAVRGTEERAARSDRQSARYSRRAEPSAVGSGKRGRRDSRSFTGRLLESSGEFIHALELNGLRPWEENQQVISVAKASDRTLVSGGDRHGCEPASVVNVTGASSFSEFAAEVRAGRVMSFFYFTTVSLFGFVCSDRCSTS